MEAQNKLKKLLFAIGVFSLGMTLTCVAADYYVSPTGSNTNTGTTSGTAFKTITKAVSMVTAGGTVHVAAGNYSENITTNANGTASARIRYISDTQGGAKIVGSGTEAMWANNGSYVDIVGFDITGSGRLGIVNMGSHTLISGNHVHNLAVSGGCTGSGGAGIVDANYNGSDCDIIGNIVHDIGIPGACNGVQGIYHSNLRGHIMNNIVYRASAFGIHLWHAATDVIIANNTVFANGSASMGGGIVIGTGDSPGGVVMNNTKIINNIVFNNPASSISEYCYSGQNCIGSGNVVANNLVYGNGSAISLKVGSATGTIAADPQFINYKADGTGDYHLKSTSPAIDKGTSTNAPSTDLDGISRPQGTGYDIGAYEFVSNTTCTAPSVPNAPSNLTILVSGTKIDLNWTDNSALESAYLVERSTDGIIFTLVISLPANTTTFTNTGMAVNTKYYYRVMAKNCFGNSVYSNVVNATTNISTGVDENAFSKISVYPNPLSSIFHINIPADVRLNDAVLEVYDVSGKEVKVVSINTNETIVDRGELKSGIYFYRVINDNQTISKGKLVIQ